MRGVKYETEEERLAARRERCRRYYQEHREEILERGKQYRQEHKEERAEYKKKYYKERPNIYKEQYAKKKQKNPNHQKEQYKNNPLKRANALVASYRAKDKKHNRGECTITGKWVVENIFTKKCAHCEETDWHKLGCNRLDNSLPHTPDNVEPCCFICNCKLGGRPKKLTNIK